MGSTRKVIKLGETIEITSYTPPSPMKATPTSVASETNDISTASVSKAGDVMMMSSDQKGELLNSLTAIDGHDRQYFNELRSTVVSRRIFIRCRV